jgi:hypothetical protein
MEIISFKMAKLTGAKKAAFLKRMAAGRLKKSGKKKTKSVRSAAPKVTKSAKVKRKSNKNNSNNMAKKKQSRSRRSKIGGIFSNPTLKKVMIGMGAASLAGTVTGMVAPQFSPIAKPLAALAVGGPIGAIAAVLADGGIGAIGGIFGGQTSSNSGGLSV